MKSLKVLLFIGLAFVCLVSSLAMNIALHEVGHYYAAKEYGFEPQIHFEVKPAETGVLRNVMFTTSIYTEYSANSDTIGNKDAVVAFAGPAVNIMISILLLFAYLMIPKTTPRKRFISTIFLFFLIPAVLSVIINLVPIIGTDGFVILQAI